MTSRELAYLAIDSERDYQSKWGDRTHSVEEYILYMEHHLMLARNLAATLDMQMPENVRAALHEVRKVTALGVVCMEDNGAPFRE